jgi:parallel beta-helix repeat protein
MMKPPRPAVSMILSVLALCLAALTSSARADYMTPGTGVIWTMDDLVAASGGVVTGGTGAYEIHQTVIISVGDRLNIGPGTHLSFLDTTGTIGLTVRGALSAIGAEAQPIVFASQATTPGAWRGLVCSDVQAGSEFHLLWCEVAYAGIAIDIVSADVLVEHCDLHDALSKVVDFSDADGTVRDCAIHNNRRYTIMMTLSSSPLIENCRMENNNIDNAQPYPYVNIGLQGTNSPTIRGCTILGSGHQMSGGIAVWALSNGVIEGNHIEGCGYGILLYQGGASPTIRNNTILSNNIHPDTVNWGFGIACNGDNAPIVAGNIIHGHWYGVCAINGGRPNLGNLGNASSDDDGRNDITGNGLSGQIYGFFNNTPLTQTAQGNWWGGATQQDVENAIWHQPDDPALGLVDYSQWLAVDAVQPGPSAQSVPAATKPTLSIDWLRPNPSRAAVRVQCSVAGPEPVVLDVLDVSGRLVRHIATGTMTRNQEPITWDGRDTLGRPVPAGVYHVRATARGQVVSRPLVVVR